MKLIKGRIARSHPRVEVRDESDFGEVRVPGSPDSDAEAGVQLLDAKVLQRICLEHVIEHFSIDMPAHDGALQFFEKPTSNSAARKGVAP